MSAILLASLVGMGAMVVAPFSVATVGGSTSACGVVVRWRLDAVFSGTKAPVESKEAHAANKRHVYTGRLDGFMERSLVVGLKAEGTEEETACLVDPSIVG